MRGRLLALVVALALLAPVGTDPVHAQSFYEGMTVRIIVGLAAGGGFDTYARAIGRHLGKHIPGNPAIIVDNMPGAGSFILANQLYRVAKPDGLTVGHLNGTLFLSQVLGQKGIEFLGAAVKEDAVCAVSKASGITSVEKWQASKTPVKLGGTGPLASPDNIARVLKD